MASFIIGKKAFGVIKSYGTFSDLMGGQSSRERLNKLTQGVQIQAPHHSTVNSSFGMKSKLLFIDRKSVFFSIYINTKERLSNYIKFNLKKQFQLPVFFIII